MKQIIAIEILILLSLCSCKLVKEDDIYLETNIGQEISSSNTQTEEPLTGKILRVDVVKEYNYEEILPNLLMGMSLEEVQEHLDVEKSYETNTWYWSIWGNMKDIGFQFGNNEYKKDGSYGIVDGDVEIAEITDWQMRGTYPQIDIDTCTSEEAIAFCALYAESLGLTGDMFTLNTYALTFDVLQATDYGAPMEDFIYMGVKDRREFWEKEGITEVKDKFPLITEMMETPNKEESPWEKKHEAVVVRYTWSLNGVPVDTYSKTTEMIYVPYYGEIVHASGNLPYVEKEVIEEVSLISKEKAMSEAKKELGTIEINNVELVYTLQVENEFAQTDELIAYPTWRVNYTKYGKKGTIWINAVDGFVCNAP